MREPWALEAWMSHGLQRVNGRSPEQRSSRDEQSRVDAGMVDPCRAPWRIGRAEGSPSAAGSRRVQKWPERYAATALTCQKAQS